MSAPKKPSVIEKMQDVKINTFSHPTIDDAFVERPDLKQRIYSTIRRFSELQTFRFSQLDLLVTWFRSCYLTKAL